jgi:hypothetical protein
MRWLVGIVALITGCLSKPDLPVAVSSCPTLQLVQATGNGNGQSGGPTTWSTSAGFAAATKPGNSIICSNMHRMTNPTNTVVAFTDDKNNTYTSAAPPITAGSPQIYDLWYSVPAHPGVQGWTVTLAQPDPLYYSYQQCWEYAGLAAIDPGAGVLSGQATSDDFSVANLGTFRVVGGDLIFVAFNDADFAVKSAGVGYTLSRTDDGARFETRIALEPARENPTVITNMANQLVLPFWAIAFVCAG